MRKREPIMGCAFFVAFHDSSSSVDHGIVRLCVLFFLNRPMTILETIERILYVYHLTIFTDAFSIC